MKKTFLIEYKIYNVLDIVIKEGKIKVKNKMSPFDAQCSLEEYLKKKIKQFGRMEVKECREETFDEKILSDFMNYLNDMS